MKHIMTLLALDTFIINTYYIIDRDYGVIAGHGRILAAKEEGIAEVPCVFADHLTEAQKKAYIGSILLSWDNGGSLNIVYGEDECRIVEP